MDADTRQQRALKIADEAARAEAHDDAAFAAEAVRQAYGDDFEAAREPAQRAYDEAWLKSYPTARAFFEPTTLDLLAAYDAAKHPASVTAAALADAVLVERDPEHKLDAVVAAGFRLTLIELAEKILI